MQLRYLSKLAKQFDKLERLKLTQFKLITMLEADSTRFQVSNKENNISSVRLIVGQHFPDLTQQQMRDEFSLPLINTIFYVSESEYAEHAIPCDRTDDGWYVIQAPISSSFTTAFMVGKTIREFELGDAYLIHNQTDSVGDIEMLDVEYDLIYDQVILNGRRCRAEPNGMIYLPPVQNAGSLSTIVLEIRQTRHVFKE